MWRCRCAFSSARTHIAALLQSASMVYAASSLVIMTLFLGAIARAAVMMARPAQVMIARSVATFMVEGIGL